MALDPRSLFRKFSFGNGPSRNAASGLVRRKLSLGFETLEPRQMLAADMAEIVGTVRVDVQGDGNPANDQVVSDASIALYRDNGNGIWDAADSLVGSPTTTDIFGKYRFANLTAGKYFVKLTLPPELQVPNGGGTKEVNISAADADGEIGQTIDGFSTEQIAEAAPPLPSSQNSTMFDSAVMGHERDFFVQLTSGTDKFSSVSLISGGGLLRLASDTTVAGNAKIVWDGQDGNASGVDSIGLGGVDFTSFNGNTMTGILLAVGADHPNCVVKLRVYTDSNHWSEYTTTVPETQGGAATKQVTFNFDDSPTSSNGGGADFANVGAVELTFVGVSAVDGQVSLVGLVGLATKTADFTAFPTLSLGDRVWSDADNDGQLDAGEQGIGGVKMNLYKDVDQNNAFTQGVDTFVATTNTNGTGNYQFGNLLPGKYVVQVDASNFGVGMVLEGLASSSGEAIDPDNNVDNDDNGSPAAGAGVVSQAINLAATNNSVDFGFYGFDLVLDKSVQQMALSPLETVLYTVKITNDGPGGAAGVQFVDTLPSGVTYKSHSVDKAGVVLQHSGGKLTGSLGTMAAGDVIIITIAADVKATATGILKNEAEVSAPNEVYTLNNRDEVENPVNPKIDLTVDKADSKDPVKPNEIFNYIITVTNNGPSNATGVEVVDTLPANVSYQGATRTPSSVVGDVATFNIGNLAAGASVSFQIMVLVDAGFTGMLHNHVEVSGNELETNYANNDDDEPTLVKVDPTSIAGNVYVDKDNDGVFDTNEKPIANVLLTLTGTDMNGLSVNKTTTTAANGSYLFSNLVPGTYQVNQTQPTQYKDGKDTIGDNGDGLQTAADGMPVPDLNDQDNHDMDAFTSVILEGGLAALDYNFGELAVTVSKRDFVRPLFYR